MYELFLMKSLRVFSFGIIPLSASNWLSLSNCGMNRISAIVSNDVLIHSPLFFDELVKNIYNMIRGNYKTIQKITETIEFEHMEFILDKINQTAIENKKIQKFVNPLHTVI